MVLIFPMVLLIMTHLLMINGICVLNKEEGKNYQTTFDRADQTMYKQKHVT